MVSFIPLVLVAITLLIAFSARLRGRNWRGSIALASIFSGVALLVCWVELDSALADDALRWSRLMSGDAQELFMGRSLALLAVQFLGLAAIALTGGPGSFLWVLVGASGLAGTFVAIWWHPTPHHVPLSEAQDTVVWACLLGGYFLAAMWVARWRWDRPATALAWLALLGALAAAIAAPVLDRMAAEIATGPLQAPTGDPTKPREAAKDALNAAGCGACHSMAGEGAGVPGGPLDAVAFRGRDTLLAFLKAPNALTAERLGIRSEATGRMAGVHLDDSARRWMTEALLILGAPAAGAAKTKSEPQKALAPLPRVQADTAKPGCLKCHDGIESIMPVESGMMKALVAMGREGGDCVVCHGGDPKATSAEAAHRGAPDYVPASRFYAAPSSTWVVQETCGVCHAKQVAASAGSLMATEAGKIQGTLHTFGAQEDKRHRYANYDVKRLPTERLPGSPAYQEYMAALEAAYPDQLPASMEGLPAPTLVEIEADPRKAAFTYLRQECQRCHVGVRGAGRRGDWRGTGCASCHVPFSNEGFTQSGDPTIPKDRPGHVAVHRIQGTRETGGIPTETCTTCHNRGKRIGVSFTGIMESPYPTPYGPGGEEQPKLHGKRYTWIQPDHHHDPKNRPENPEGAMLCQDCHSSVDVHGDGRVFGTTLAQVEIECSDCHGTTRAFPWELPLGYMDEFSTERHAFGPAGDAARGLAEDPGDEAREGTLYAREQGYLLTARGNPLGNVVRRVDREATGSGGDEQVIMHSATGVDLRVPQLKTLHAGGAMNEAATTAMHKVGRHMERMECYSCHASWAAQCYGCHVRFDYRPGQKGKDWIASGLAHKPDGSTAGWRNPEIEAPTMVGKSHESRGYLRWEDPPLGVNGEGRVTPVIPGCQPVTTVINAKGEAVVQGKIWEVEGKPGIDMSPTQPHTMDKRARRCESCHTDPKALGYGEADGRFLNGYEQARVLDITIDGKAPAKTQAQFNAVPDLPHDWSQIVTRDGEQLQTVGSHWPLSRPLDATERARVEKTGLCLGCHGLQDDALWEQAARDGTFDARAHAAHLRGLLRAGTKARAPAAQRDETPEPTPAPASTTEPGRSEGARQEG